MENKDVVKAYYKMEAEFMYSYGRISRFFGELKDNKKIMGTKCPKCGIVFCPPTSDCPKCWVPTEWVEVGPKGTLLHYTVIGLPPLFVKKPVPFTLGYVKFDGADTGILVFIDETDLKKLKNGLRVEAVFKEERDGHITDIDYCKVI
ncbi:MAG: Zn-ribbon domain-containing OB-fold protein [Syntrophorhabdales bacterium]|jgi:uncharacterized OB-fold protein